MLDIFDISVYRWSVVR